FRCVVIQGVERICELMQGSNIGEKESRVAKGKKKRRGADEATRSRLDQHKREGKLLRTPLQSLKSLQPASWLHERLPDLLWAALLVSGLGRGEALDAFRRVAKATEGKFQPNRPIDVGFTGIANLPTDLADEIIGALVAGSNVKEALRPLLLLHELPAR